MKDFFKKNINLRDFMPFASAICIITTLSYLVFVVGVEIGVNSKYEILALPWVSAIVTFLLIYNIRDSYSISAIWAAFSASSTYFLSGVSMFYHWQYNIDVPGISVCIILFIALIVILNEYKQVVLKKVGTTNVIVIAIGFSLVSYFMSSGVILLGLLFPFMDKKRTLIAIPVWFFSCASTSLAGLDDSQSAVSAFGLMFCSFIVIQAYSSARTKFG